MYRYSRTALCAPLAYACASTLVSTSGREPPYLSSKLLSAPGRVRSTASAGTPVPAIARLVAADEDTVRDVIHAFNDRGLAALDPHWAGGAPRRISDDDVAFIVTTAATRPKKLALPFTRFSVRKLAAYLQGRYGHHDPKQVPARQVRIRRERLRRILAAHDITFQRTRTWKESTDADFESKLDRIEEGTTEFLGRCFAFDQFGPLSIRPCHGTCWAARNHPDR